MNTDRIKQIQQETAYPESVSVQQALLKVWNETEQEQLRIGAVSGRSELLRAFSKWYEEKYRFEISEEAIKEFEHLGS